MSHSVLLYYRYTRIADPEQFRDEQRALCERLGLRGRIIVAAEGINGTVSGTAEAAADYISALESDPRTAGIEIKVDAADGHVFPKLSVKVRDEIVSLHLGERDLDPTERSGRRLGPAQFRAAMEDPDVVVLDGRNAYESALGRFEGAVCPPVEHFRDFPEWIRSNLGGAKDKKILTYCTGGIRCEKLSAFLLQEGFRDVCQLDGGIIRYGQDAEVRGDRFEGRCYVFDERIAVDVNARGGRSVISSCGRCGASSDRYVNCRFPPCNAQIFLCGACEDLGGRFCSGSCREQAAARLDGRGSTPPGSR